MRVVLVGTGAVGRRTARQLSATPGLDDLVLVDADARRAPEIAEALGPPARSAAWSSALMDGADVLVVAAPGDPRPWVEAALARRVHAVCATDTLPGTKALLALDAEARERDVAVVVGAGFVPGLSCLLARHASAGFDHVEEIHVAKLGTGGPACAKGHHDALTRAALDWRNGAWVPRPGGSGRELCWFPDPVGGRDCYRAALPDSLLLQPAFPGVRKITARVAATRRDRLSAPFPMLRPPHPEGSIGAVRVEVRGTVAGTTEVKVLGAIDRPAVAAGAVAAVAAIWAADGRLARAGAGGLAGLVDDPVPFLHELAARGVRAAAFEGASV